jgi:hypothetical protein
MNSQNKFRVYNNNLNFKINDAIKLTSEYSETFWVEVKSINGNVITGKVLNKLIHKHDYDADDIITFNKNNVKLVNPFESRNIMCEENKKIISKFIKFFNIVHKRDPTEIEFEHFINTRIISN